jgi:hypothetical protein
LLSLKHMKGCYLVKAGMIGLLTIIFPLILAACSIGNNSGTGTLIDWVDFIVLGDIQYVGNYYGDNKLVEGSIDKVIGEVKFNVSNNTKKTDYKLKNGDAAYLPKGTKIYSINGYKPEFRIAVNTEGEWRIYEADTNPGAKKGEDLLDISDKVLYIGINNETDGTTELGAIKGMTEVGNLVNIVLNSDVDQSSHVYDGQRYFISFHLQDGSSITKCYWIDSGELSRGIMLPDEFGIEIKKALSVKN